MRRQLPATIFLAVCVAWLLSAASSGYAQNSPADPHVRYVPLDASAGTSQAVVVEGCALAHTRQLLPLDRQGSLVGKGTLDLQVAQVLENLAAVLQSGGSGLDRLVRVNVYAMEPAGVDRLREELTARLGPDVRPAVTSVLTPLPHRDALVAVDAVAAADDAGPTVVRRRCDSVAGDDGAADVAVLPRGGVAYISGVPAEGGLTESAVDASAAGLQTMLKNLDLHAEQIVHLKVFLRPASSAGEVLAKIKSYFPDGLAPPVAFVEWLAPPPVEIELIAQLPRAGRRGPRVEYYNPPDAAPLQIFSRAALVRTERQIYVGGLYPRKPSGAQDQALDVFNQLQTILAKTGSDLRHMVKGTYYVIDDGSARGMDRARLWLYDADRAPAASKCMVHGVGQSKRILTMDMIAVETEK